MKQVSWQALDEAQRQQLLTRPAVAASKAIDKAVAAIIDAVRTQGDDALIRLTHQFDQVALSSLRVSAEAIRRAGAALSPKLKAAMDQACRNITSFHQAQRVEPVRVETQPGVLCEQITQPINAVGLYIPGGSAPLLSTVLMLGIPARIAGCPRRVLCTPPPVANEILYAAELCGISEIYTVGGAQAIAAMAYGTDTIARVDKIFGPGNAFVTEAKRQVSADLQGAGVDMPAGPSEVLVIADDSADPGFIAADLLSQAEHGPDSQVILVTPSSELAGQTMAAVTAQLATLPRAAIARQALASSLVIVTDSLAQCLTIANRYGPEHLIVQTRDPRALLPQINQAGSVFLGRWAPESMGDYASGTNHVLPTYGYTRSCSSLGLADFTRRMTVQELTVAGFQALAPTVSALAEAEGLEAHRRAVTLRVAVLQEQQG